MATAFMHCTRRWLWLALLLLALPFAVFGQTTGVGFQSITIQGNWTCHAKQENVSCDANAIIAVAP